MKALFKIACPLVLAGGMLFTSGTVYAVDVSIKITGEIYIPPCKINNDAVVNIPFGKIALQQVDGQQLAVSKTLDITCEYYQGTPYIVVTGNAIAGVVNNNVLDTTGVNAGGLGIALYQGKGIDAATPLKIGTGGPKAQYGYPLTNGLTGNGASGQFTFTAVPWKKSGVDLKAGQFSATATMSISYL